VHAYDQLRDTILSSVAADDSDTALSLAREQIRQWDGHASADSRAMPILDRYYDQLLEHLLGPVLLHIREINPNFQYRWPLVDETMRRVLDERPAHFLPGEYSNWNEWLREILRRSLTAETGATRARAWGSVNRLDVSHPLGGIPLLSRWLAWPSPELPGNTFSLRVAKPDFGAVIRMNVRPASPETGILQLAGGQSGHFLSPNYSDQLADWADGTPTAFLAGATRHTYVLQP
jgi:penicillin amidase